MDICKQVGILQALATDTEAQVGSKVTCELCPKRNGETYEYLYRFRVPNPGRCHVFAYGQVKPKIGCPRINIKTRHLNNTNPAKLSLFDRPRNSMFGENDGGRRIEICKMYGDAYRQALYALIVACQVCLES
jgi:hypothetical protein